MNPRANSTSSLPAMAGCFCGRAMLAIVDGLFAALIIAVALCALPLPAFAYVDPSVMTYTIQALAGVAVALSAVLGVFWRRARRFVLKVLNIDENRGKTVDPSVRRISPDEAPHADAVAVAEKETGEGAAAASAGGFSRYGKRFAFALVVMAFFMYTVFVSAPFELVDGNTASLSFGVKDIFFPLVIFSVIVGVAGALGLASLKGRAFPIALATIFALGLCAFLQALFMNSGLPGGDSGEIPWGDYATTMAVNALIWAAIVALCIFLSTKRAYASSVLCIVFSLVLILVQTVALARPLYHGIISPNKTYITQDGLFDVSQKGNVIVIVLDTVDNIEVEAVRAADPSLFDGFNGFTYFPDSVGVMQATRYAMPNLLTGEKPHDDDTPESYVKERWNRSSFLQEIKDAGYDISLYSDSFFKNRSQLESLTTNVHALDQFPVDWVGTIATMGKVALYRDAPWALKPLFSYSTPEVVRGVIGDNLSESLMTLPYESDDAKYYARLKEVQLNVDESGDEEAGFFKIIHLEGAHTPYTMNSDAERVEKSNVYEQTIGSLKIVEEYLDQLKALGLYDEATIIVTADHGHWYWPCTETVTEPATPFIMVKESGSGADAPFRVSWAPVSQEDFQATVMKAVGGDWRKYGQTYFDIPEDADRPRYWNMMIWTPEKGDVEWRQLAINGNALDIANWSETGKSWYFDDFNIDDMED